MALNILDVVQLGRERVLHIHDEDFPVGLALVKQGHNAEHLDLFHLADIADLFANFTDVKWVIVALSLGLCMCLRRVFPSLYVQKADGGRHTTRSKIDVLGSRNFIRRT